MIKVITKYLKFVLTFRPKWKMFIVQLYSNHREGVRGVPPWTFVMTPPLEKSQLFWKICRLPLICYAPSPSIFWLPQKKKLWPPLTFFGAHLWPEYPPWATRSTRRKRPTRPSTQTLKRGRWKRRTEGQTSWVPMTRCQGLPALGWCKWKTQGTPEARCCTASWSKNRPTACPTGRK